MRFYYPARTTAVLALLLLLSSALLSSCGFQLRGVTNLSFKTVKLQGANLSLKRDLIRNITANNLTLVDDVFIIK